MRLFNDNIKFDLPIRSIGVKASALCWGEQSFQLSLFGDQIKRDKCLALEKTVDVIRHRYGAKSVQRLMMLQDGLLSGFNPKQDHVNFPESYFKG